VQCAFGDEGPDQSLRHAEGDRDGASVGYILCKHWYPKRTVGRMLIRPIGGALVALARHDGTEARFHLSTLRGRLLGYKQFVHPEGFESVSFASMAFDR
jgi:hypothetical protein